MSKTEDDTQEEDSEQQLPEGEKDETPFNKMRRF